MNEVIENIITRRSVRKYLDLQIKKEELDNILLAGSYAPSGMGKQSWKFTAVQNKEMLDKINKTIRQTLLSMSLEEETNPNTKRLIERAKEKEIDYLFGAPTFIIVSNLKDNRNSMADSALAIGNMMLSAHSLGIGTCWLNQIPRITDQPLMRELFNELDIPKDHIVYGTISLGYPVEKVKKAAPRKDVINIIR